MMGYTASTASSRNCTIQVASRLWRRSAASPVLKNRVPQEIEVIEEAVVTLAIEHSFSSIAIPGKPRTILRYPTHQLEHVEQG